MPCYSPLKGWIKQGGGFTGDFSISIGSKMEVACGQCLGCRLDYARMWSLRIMHEASLYDSCDGGGNGFITLTYDDEHLPEDWSLKKRDWQLFMKRFRKKLARDKDDCVRFFMCGEYGNYCRHGHTEDCDTCTYGRPHYHAIIFNWFPEGDDLTLIKEDGDTRLYESELLNDAWGNGMASVGLVTTESAGYVARYAIKKITGKMAEAHYGGLQPEFGLMSNRPGIGKRWFMKFRSDVFPSDEVPVPGGGICKKVPAYYQKLEDRLDPEGIEEVKLERAKYMKENKGEFTPERLKSKYMVKKAQIKTLNRKL